MSNKRTRQFSPEQLFNNNNKKQFTSKQPLVVMETTQSDVFSWDKLCSLLDVKLKDVAKKEDISLIKSELDDLRQDNYKLRNEVKLLSSRIEQIDHRSRSTNIVVNGLVSTTTSTVKSEFIELCNNHLGVDIKVATVRALSTKNTKNTYLFSLESQLQAVNVLAVKNKLKGRNIFIAKDYTKEEQNIRYNLRKVIANIAKHNANVKRRLGEFCIYIDDIKYFWSSGKLVANSIADAEFLKGLLSKGKYNVEVFVNDKVHVNPTSFNNSYMNGQ